MSVAAPLRPRRSEDSFRHEALLYAGEGEFLSGTAPFIRAAVAAQEPILVVLNATNIDRLRTALGDDAGSVLFADMAEVGVNPARSSLPGRSS